MGDPSGGVPHLPGSLNLSKRDFEELLAIVAKSKEDELRNGLSASQQRRSTVKRKGKSRSEQAGKDQAQALNSINWLVDQEEEPEIDQGIACCCGCCFHRRKPREGPPENRTKSAMQAILAWDIHHCKDAEDFLGLMTMVTKNAEETVQGLHSILAKLSYVGDEDPEVEKLSMVGGYLWLITYGMQYITISRALPPSEPNSAGSLVDPDPDEIQFHPNPRLNTRIMETHQAYEEIARIVQEWVLLTMDFLRRMKDLRQNGAQLVRILQNRFRFKKNPFKNCPEVKPLELTPKKAVVRGVDQPQASVSLVNTRHVAPKQASTLSRKSQFQLDRTVQNQSLRVHWSPVVVLVQAMPGGRWDIFSSLETPEKVELIAMFIQEPLRLLNSCTKTFKRSIAPSDVVEQPDSERSSSIVEVTCGLLHFTTSTKFQNMRLSPAELDSFGKTVDDFWLTVDTLHEKSLQVSRLVSETRDIVRSCYIYSDNFYNWNLKSFDVFEHPKQSTEQEERMKRFVTDVIGTKDVVDVAKFYSIADFTTSHYQYVLQQNPVSSHGVALKLESWDDFKNEPWGLVDKVVDQRKANTLPGKSKSRNFVLAYRTSL